MDEIIETIIALNKMDCCARSNNTNGNSWSSGDENNLNNPHGPDGDNDNNKSDEPSASLRLRSGFISLKERLANLTKQAGEEGEHTQTKLQRQTTETTPSARQFATLQELFSAKHNLSYEKSEPEYCVSKTKIPIMRLKKDDWNVKCWEERLNPHRRRAAKTAKTDQNTNSASKNSNRSGQEESRPTDSKPKLQAEVFNNRIADVASKLDKVREGAPQDEILYKLASNRMPKRKIEPTQEWTTLLKEELTTGAHNPKTIEAHYASIGREQQASGVKSPIGRYIGRIIDSDSDSERDQSQNV